MTPSDASGAPGSRKADSNKAPEGVNPNPPIRPHPELKQEFPGIGPAWLVVAGVAGLVFIFLYIRMVG